MGGAGRGEAGHDRVKSDENRSSKMAAVCLLPVSAEKKTSWTQGAELNLDQSGAEILGLHLKLRPLIVPLMHTAIETSCTHQYVFDL